MSDPCDGADPVVEIDPSDPRSVAHVVVDILAANWGFFRGAPDDYPDRPHLWDSKVFFRGHPTCLPLEDPEVLGAIVEMIGDHWRAETGAELPVPAVEGAIRLVAHLSAIPLVPGS